MNVSNIYNKVQNLPVRNFVVSSAKRQTGTNINWITNQYFFTAKYIALRYINFINNVYFINQYSNKLVINSVVYTLTNGVYSINQLVTLMNASQAVIVFSYNSNTNKLTLTSSGTDVIEFSPLLGNDILGFMLGLTPKTGGSINLSASYTGIYEVNLNPTAYIDICSNKLNMFTGSSFGDCNGSLLYRIPIQQYQYGSSILEEVKTPKLLAMNDAQLGALDFYVIDDMGRPYPLDGNCSIEIVFDIYL